MRLSFLSLPPIKELRRDVALVLGFNFLLTWLYIVVFPRNAFSPLPLGELPLPEGGVAVGVSLVAVTLFAALAPGRFDTLVPQLRYMMPSLSFIGVGAVAISHRQNVLDGDVLVMVGAVLVGCGCAGCQLLWLDVLRRFGDSGRTNIYVAGAYACVGPTMALVIGIPAPAFPVIAAVLPLLSMASMAYALRNAVAGPGVRSEAIGPTPKASVFGLQIDALLFGQLLLIYLWGTQHGPSARGTLAAYIVCSVAFLALFALTVRRRPNIPLLARYRVPLILVVAGFMALSLFSPYAESGNTVATSFAWTALVFGSTLFFVMLLDGARELPIAPTSTFGLAMASAYLLSLVLSGLVGSIASIASPILLAVAYILVIAGAVVPGAAIRMIPPPADLPPLQPTGMPHEDAVAASCARLAAEYGLTSREQEVLCLLALGRSIPYIEAKLVIAQGTAKAHANRIYRKLGVHTRQELLDLTSKRV